MTKCVTSRKNSNRQIYPNETLLPKDTAGLKTDSIALCYQVRTIDKNRLIKLLGELNDHKVRQKIKESLRFQLEI